MWTPGEYFAFVLIFSTVVFIALVVFGKGDE